MDAKTLIIIFMVAPLGSFLIDYFFFSKDSHDHDHFFHVFSVSYLAVLAFYEIDEIISHDWVLRLIFLVSLAALILFVRYRHRSRADKVKSDKPKTDWNILSHHHHKQFSYFLGGLFILHSFIDGILFGSGEIIQGGLVIHRLIDGFVIFDLIGRTSGGLRSYRFFKKDNLVKTFMMLVFVCAPLIGLYLPVAHDLSFLGILQKLCFFILATFAVLDIELEFLQKHGMPSNRFFVAIFAAIILGVSVMIAAH